MKQETMRCNIIAQRISLQEFLIEKEADILKDIEAWTSNEEEIKKLDRATVEEMFDTWLSEWQLVQPSKFFQDHPTNDSELVCSIQTEKEFLLTTLQFFGLNEGYMEGKGHFPNWGKEKNDKKAQRKKQLQKNKQTSRPNKKILEMKKKKGLDKKGDEDVKPTHFDISLFQKSLKKFTQCNGEERSKMRKILLKDINRTMKVFLDDFNEQSFKKCVDVYELATRLMKEGYELDPVLMENMGAILLCFGEIEHEQHYGERVPPETEEDKRARQIIEIKLKEREDARKEAEENGEAFDESELPPIPTIEPRKPVLMLLHLISITDMKFCAQKMFEFDKVLQQMDVQKFDISEEQAYMAMLTKKYKKKFYDEDEVHKMADEPSKIYSENNEI